MKKVFIFLFLFAITILVPQTTLQAQTLSTDPKQDVMLQGFYWDSYNNANVKASGGLYNYLKALSIFEKLNYKIWIADCNGAVGNIYYWGNK